MRSLILLMLFSGMLAAETICQRQDIDYYLSKGFTPAQVTAICTASKPSDIATQPTTRPASPKSAQQADLADKPALFLLAAIDAQKPEIKDGTLLYTEKRCFEYGISGPFGRRDRLCPEITFNIALTNLEIVSHTKRNALFGKNKILVKGLIRPQILNLEQFDSNGKKALNREIIATGTTEIPIQSNVGIEEVISALTQLIQ